MRRAVVAVIIGGYAFWAFGSGLGHQPVIVGARLTAAVKSANPAKAAKPTSGSPIRTGRIQFAMTGPGS